VRETTRLSTRRDQREQALFHRALKTLLLPLSLLCFAAAFPALFMMRRAGPNLFELTPRVPSIDDYTLVAWHDLEYAYGGALRVGGPSAGSPTRVLGYMMDTDHPIQDGDAVDRFVLLPDAGSAVHPAHRFGDQMIDVQLRTGTAILFKEGSLVWVWGTWKAIAGDSAGDKPLYQLQEAQAKNVDEEEISKYFR
jgi:hypothetical protein